MIYLKLFISFLQIGFLAFGGGYAILPFIQEIVVNQHNWLSMREITDVVTISQMTPGPIALNAATFVGTKLAGILGSIVASLAIVIPQLIIMVLLAKLYFSDKEISFMDKIIKALRPAVAGLITIATIDMIKGSVFNDGTFSLDSISYVALVSFIVGLALKKTKLGIINLIVIGAILGLVLTPIL